MPSLIGLASIPSGPGIGPMFAKIQGAQEQQAYTDQATALGQQSTYAYQQSLLEAAQNDYQVTKTKATQNAQFSASGVSLSGSPLGILTETQQLGNQVTGAIKLQGQLQSDLLQEQGLQMLRSGSAAAFGGQATALNDQYNYQLQKAQAVNSAIGGALGFGLGAVSNLVTAGAGGGVGAGLATSSLLSQAAGSGLSLGGAGGAFLDF